MATCLLDFSRLFELQSPATNQRRGNVQSKCPRLLLQTDVYRTNFRLAPSQWKTALLCNDVSHWIGANPESALWSYSTDVLIIPRMNWEFVPYCLEQTNQWLVFFLIFINFLNDLNRFFYFYFKYIYFNVINYSLIVVNIFWRIFINNSLSYHLVRMNCRYGHCLWLAKSRPNIGLSRPNIGLPQHISVRWLITYTRPCSIEVDTLDTGHANQYISIHEVLMLRYRGFLLVWVRLYFRLDVFNVIANFANHNLCFRHQFQNKLGCVSLIKWQ